MGCYYYNNTKCSTNGGGYVPGHWSRHFSDITSFSPYGNPEKYLMIRKLKLRGRVKSEVTQLICGKAGI